jgi:hypothetical protein
MLSRKIKKQILEIYLFFLFYKSSEFTERISFDFQQTAEALNTRLRMKFRIKHQFSSWNEV